MFLIEFFSDGSDLTAFEFGDLDGAPSQWRLVNLDINFLPEN
jgi:hypothetical protein